MYTWGVVIRSPAPPEITEPSDGAQVYDLAPTVSGRTVPKGQVACYLGETTTKIGIAEANEAGEWSLRPPQEMQEGEYTLRCDVTDEAGNPSEEVSRVSFTVFAPRAQAHAIGGGLGCATSGGSPWLTLMELLVGAVWNSRRRR
jgi:hypothetical protein